MNKKTKPFSIIAILLLFLYIFLPLSNVAVKAEEKEEYFAKVENTGVYFYSNPNESDRLFELPQSYFVRLTGKANDDFYNATYMDKIGYVKINEVKPMDGTPQNAYASATFRVFDMEGLGLYKSPNLKSSELIANVPYLTTIMTYYGKIEGESIPNKSNLWYYCKFSDNNSTYQGYLYSVFCDEMSVISTNMETFPVITTTLFSSSANVGGGLSDIAKTFIIIGVSLPCAVVIYLLIKPTLSGQPIKTKHKKTRKRHGDYFEFDENDLT